MADMVVKKPDDEITDEQVMALMIKGDFSGLGLSARAKVLFRIAERHGLDPWQQPFILLPQRDNTLKLYATKNCAQQVRDNLKIKTEVVYKGALRLYETPMLEYKGPGNEDRVSSVMVMRVDPDIYEVEVKATDKDGREETEIGTAQIGGLDVAQRRNAPTLAMTRAKRRAYLNLGKISVPDEVEGDFSRPPRMAAAVAAARGEEVRDLPTKAVFTETMPGAPQTAYVPSGEAQQPMVSLDVETPPPSATERRLGGLPKAVPTATGPRSMILGPPVAPTKPPTK